MALAMRADAPRERPLLMAMMMKKTGKESAIAARASVEMRPA